MIIIGFGHRARCGKDSVCQFIIDKFAKENGGPYEIKKYSFADELKSEVRGRERELCEQYGVPCNQDSDGKYRELLQFWGTEFRRAQDQEYWVKKLSSRLDIELPQIALISDVRYRNEAEWIKDRDGYYIRVERYKDQQRYLHPGIDHQHSSETELELYPDWFAEIRCDDGAINELRQSAEECFGLIVRDLDVVGQFLDQLRQDEQQRLNDLDKRELLQNPQRMLASSTESVEDAGV